MALPLSLQLIRSTNKFALADVYSASFSSTVTLSDFNALASAWVIPGLILPDLMAASYLSSGTVVSRYRVSLESGNSLAVREVYLTPEPSSRAWGSYFCS